MTVSPATVYQQQIQLFSAQRKRTASRMRWISWSRLAIIVLLVAAIWNLKSISLLYTGLTSTLLLVVFLRLVLLSARLKEHHRNLEHLLQINEQELQVAAGSYTHLPSGSQFVPDVHDYAHDLDLFGKASLYQYINRTTSEQGHHLLAQWLLSPAPLETILQRQSAARELAPLYAWRQQYQAFGLAEELKIVTQQRIAGWRNEPNQFNAKQWTFYRFAGPLIMLTCLILWLTDHLGTLRFIQLVAVSFVLSSLISRKVNTIYLRLDKTVKEISTLLSLIQWIESAQWSSPLLQQVQSLCSAQQQKTASTAIRQLKDILNRLEYRLNPTVFLPLNTFLFWDLQQVLALEKWKDDTGSAIDGWFEAVQMAEALCTVATVQFNHPDWVYPQFTSKEGVLQAKELGHPLIQKDKRVCSSFSTEGLGKIALITGSNMAGKSTFLRSTGVNIVLAMMGSVVCAEECMLSPMRVISSMRVTDNLEENTSTFYAELKKLRHIIEEVNRGEKVYLLLDEILRGTNSLDRHTGSKALIEQLIRQHATAMVATHDIELASLHQTYPTAITNYHFDVQVSSNDELYFDYKLKTGICQSLNASILMRKIGIEF